jgi:hypothetical protein
MRSSRMITTTRLIIYGGLVAFALVLWLQSRQHHRRAESFVDIEDIKLNMDNINLGEIPDPQHLFKRLRTIIDRYDNPEAIQQITDNIDKDPGQLARKQLGIQNE